MYHWKRLPLETFIPMPLVGVLLVKTVSFQSIILLFSRWRQLEAYFIMVVAVIYMANLNHLLKGKLVFKYLPNVIHSTHKLCLTATAKYELRHYSRVSDLEMGTVIYLPNPWHVQAKLITSHCLISHSSFYISERLTSNLQLSQVLKWWDFTAFGHASVKGESSEGVP